MRKLIKWIIIAVITIIAIILIFSAYYKYGQVKLDKNHSDDITSYTDSFCLNGLYMKDGWVSYSQKEMKNGKWYGGITNNGLIISCAQSSKKSTRVYTRVGSWDTKHWSGWSEVGEKSIRQANTSFGVVGAMAMGAWYGYEAK